MEPGNDESDLTRRSARIYAPLSLGAGGLFYFAASLTGNHDLVARVGGAVWVGMLALIIAMPLVTARTKRRRRES